MINSIIAKFFGTASERKIKLLQDTVDKINALEPEISILTDEQLKAKTPYFRELLAKGKTLDEILPEAFAVVREGAKRAIGLRHFDVQLIGGMVLHQGNISEMKTGEGKTLVATLAAYLNALPGDGVYVVTVNDYLARRDSEWMGNVYRFLGLTVGVIQSQMNHADRKVAYAADITYGTNNEFGFDYLRDNMATSIEECVQRKLNYAIVDEVDSILIDEARTPLIISGMVKDTTNKYKKLADVAKKLILNEDFTLDEKQKNVVMTEPGIEKVEKYLGLESLFDVANLDTAHMVVQCLKAYRLFKRDVDYVIKDGEIVIVDEFTGRLMIGRRYSDGLHQAIEAIEDVKIKSESQTLASITFQNYFRMFAKLAGMTGTAMTEESEFLKIYGLEVIEIPTNRPMVRFDAADVIYKSKKEKYKAIVNEAAELHKKGIPVLVGTIAIETSELLSEMLDRKGVPHTVLNAKYHEKEAEIISKAGQPGAVTIATNMAGRGTDIVLGAEVPGLGGLHVIGTERHESRRIDNQLRGRSGRQGDNGYSRFYVSLEDDLMRLFGSDRIARIMETLGLPDDTPIEHAMVSRAIEKAQKKVEMHNFEIRKQILKYDDVMNKQRDSFYKLRRLVLEGQNLKQKVREIMAGIIEDYINLYIPEKINIEKDSWDKDDLIESLLKIFPIENIKSIIENGKTREKIVEELNFVTEEVYKIKESMFGHEPFREIERIIMLRMTDTKWIDHLHNMDVLRDGIGLRAYGQKDPLVEYKIEGFTMFREMMTMIEEESIAMLYRVHPIEQELETPPVLRPAPVMTLSPVAQQLTYHGSASAEVPPQAKSDDKPGRNDLCTCGSGKKYKKCCGK